MSDHADLSTVKVLGVKIDNISLSQMLGLLKKIVDHEQKAVFSNVNIHALNIAYSTRWFRQFLNSSAVNYCDGFGVRLAAKLMGKNLSYRYTPPDFVDHIAEIACQSGWRMFFLGAKPGVAQCAADKLMNTFPDLQVETWHGFFDKQKDSFENSQVVAQINKFRPQILIVGFGMPLQERWILENFEDLGVNIVLPAGALFDYMAGEIRRAPDWMTQHGLEWLGRLLIEPRRLWKRYLIGNPLFFWRVLVHCLMKIPLPV